MKHSYEDILCHPRPVSTTHAAMSPLRRAAQFSPFAALSGYQEAVEETARLTEAPISLAVDAQADLNGKLVILQNHLSQSPRVTVTYFAPDPKKAGGAYVTAGGTVRKLDVLEQWLLLEDGTKVFFRDLLSLEGPLFPAGFSEPPGHP